MTDRTMTRRELLHRGGQVGLGLAGAGVLAACGGSRAPVGPRRDTDWSQVVALYDQLARLDPSPIVRLNRTIAVAELDGPDIALAEVDGLPLEGYHAFHATRADLLRRLSRNEESRTAYDRAKQQRQPERGQRADPDRRTHHPSLVLAAPTGAGSPIMSAPRPGDSEQHLAGVEQLLDPPGDRLERAVVRLAAV
jgi:hypothetical protein